MSSCDGSPDHASAGLIDCGPVFSAREGRPHMERSAAMRLLAGLHKAQNAFYAGRDDTELRKIHSPDIEWTVPGRNAIAGLYP